MIFFINLPSPSPLYFKHGKVGFQNWLHFNAHKFPLSFPSFRVHIFRNSQNIHFWLSRYAFYHVDAIYWEWSLATIATKSTMRSAVCSAIFAFIFSSPCWKQLGDLSCFVGFCDIIKGFRVFKVISFSGIEQFVNIASSALEKRYS